MSAPPAAPQMGAAEWTMLLILSVLWGGSFFFIKVAVTDLPPLTVVLGRVAIAALALWAAIALMGETMRRDRAAWIAFVGMGVLNNVIPFSLIFWGQTQIASALAAMLNATTPLFTVLVAHAATKDEKLTAPKLAGVLAGLAGVAIMIGPQALGGLGVDVLAQLACVAGAFSYALSGVYGRRFKALGVSPMQTAAGQLTASTLMMIPVVMLVDAPWRLAMPSAGAIAAVVALALVSTAIAYVLFFRILARAGATNLLLVTFLIPVSAFALGYTFLGETLEPRHLAGMATIGLGLAAIDGRPVRWLLRAGALTKL